MKLSTPQGLWSDLPCSLWDCLASVAMYPGQQDVVSASERQLRNTETPSAMGTVLPTLCLPAMDLLGKIHQGVKL